MPTRPFQRASRALLLVCAAQVGCAEESADFVELAGTVEGQPFTFRQQAYHIACDSSTSEDGYGEPCLSLRALQLTNLTTNLLRGVRLTFLKEKVKAGAAYEVSDTTPAKVYVIQAVQNEEGKGVYADAAPLTGKVTLTSMGTQEGQAVSGTLEGLDVYEEGKSPIDTAPQVRITSGSFRYVWPSLQ